MSSRVFLSFRHLCLDNLPEGRFERRVIAAVDAGAMIRTARATNTLSCVSNLDCCREHESSLSDVYSPPAYSRISPSQSWCIRRISSALKR
jgi:hypothetical protein